jgi:hypothetical protein
VFYWLTIFVLENVPAAAEAKAVGYAPPTNVYTGTVYGVTVATKNL